MPRCSSPPPRFRRRLLLDSHRADEGDRILSDYFLRETRRLSSRNEAFLEGVTDWPATQAEMRRQLFEMLGLQPLPARSDLKAQVTGTTERDGVIVENVVFQSRPGLYVTANFYRPSKQDGPLPTILMSAATVVTRSTASATENKTTYQHHGAWFARNGYTCLILDTLQLGEIEGKHHGTHNLGRWWWNSRGYTRRGRGLERDPRPRLSGDPPEVDKTRFGVTGRSGGGAYTLWIAASTNGSRSPLPSPGSPR